MTDFSGDVVVIADDSVEVISTGDQGPPGLRGNSVLNGTTDPVSAVGIPGDFYLNTDAMEMFGPKTTTWPFPGAPLHGPPGPQGDPGQQGSQGPPCEIRLKPDGYSEAMPDAVPGEAGRRSDAKPDTIPK